MTPDLIYKDHFTNFNKKSLLTPFKEAMDGFKIYCNPIGAETILITTGIGKINAAQATAFGISVFNPSSVVNIGLCGSLKTDLYHIGDMVSVCSLFQHDFYIPFKGKEFDSLFDIIDLDISATAANSELSGYSVVKLATGDSFIDNKDSKHELSQIADVVDMEGYAIARTCQIFKKKLMMYKVVSDGSDERSELEFDKIKEKYELQVGLLLDSI
jgi:adenosylhomocysteine nucleosidase